MKIHLFPRIARQRSWEKSLPLFIPTQLAGKPLEGLKADTPGRFPRARAKAENKNSLLDFMGSDWCRWCEKPDAEIFHQPEWKSCVAKKFALVAVDSPHSLKLPDIVSKRSEVLKTELKATGFPTLIIPNKGGT